MTDWNGSWHPLAERFPMPTDDELREMADDIAAQGQAVPCVMTSDGVGLDGRSRVAACALVEVEPRWEVYDGDPVEWIIALNVDRRHLSTGQRAMARALAMLEAGDRQSGRWRRGSVGIREIPNTVEPNTWRDAVKDAGFVLDHAPHLADAVLGGDLALSAALAIAKQRQAEQHSEPARMVRLRSAAPDLAELVANGQMSVAEGEAAQREREQERDRRVRADTAFLDTNVGPLVLVKSAQDPALPAKYADSYRGTLSAADFRFAAAFLTEIADNLEGDRDEP